MNEEEFKDKYGFSLDDLYYSCIDDILKKSYYLYSVKDIGYQIQDKIHEELGQEYLEPAILCKQIKDSNTYNIAIPYKDIYFTFKVTAESSFGNLNVESWSVENAETIEETGEYEDIDYIEDSSEEEL